MTQVRYSPYDIQICRAAWDRLRLDETVPESRPKGMVPDIIFYRRLANSLNMAPEREGGAIRAGNLNLYALLNRIYRYLLHQYRTVRQPREMEGILRAAAIDRSTDVMTAMTGFVEQFPGAGALRKKESAAAHIASSPPGSGGAGMMAEELLLLSLTMENPALHEFRELYHAPGLVEAAPFRRALTTIDTRLAAAPPYDPFDLPILELLRLPVRFSPSSLPGQLEYIRDNWGEILPRELLSQVLLAFDILHEEEREWRGGPGEPQVLEFRRAGTVAGGATDYPEYERFSRDADWMSNVVMIAKMVYVWMDQLSKRYGRHISRLDQIPDDELDRLAVWGFNAVWLIGVWERSPASQKIKQLCGNPDAVSSAYSLYDYTVAADLGGGEALDNLRERMWRRGVRLASDMVPNHTGIYSRWTREHPDWFVQLDHPPYPAYSFTGPDLSDSPEIGLYIEDGYWDRRDAAVVFRHVDNASGRVRHIYHGNDGTSTPWNDTAQLNYLIPEVREAVIRTIVHVARQFPIIRFDAAMTLAKKHYQRLWYPQPGHGSGVPSRAGHGMDRAEFDRVFPNEFWREVVDRMAVEAPDTLLLAEAFWLMEGYFVRTLGMHRVYNSAFMNMLKMEENAKYRQTIKNTLEFDPQILKRFVNFMSNPDERTAVDQFGKEGKYFGAAVLLVTMPGLPMFGHGQIEGFTEKYGMEYRRAYWEEEIDRHLVAMHEARIFPLMKRRRLFSGSENFNLYDFFAGDRVDENVFAYSNRVDGERGLIVFHNSFASTSGWINRSCARVSKGGGGETEQVSTTLAEALGFNAEGRHYYAFRDYASGLEYLRHGRELAEMGLHVELSAYECHAFLDFREILDDDFGTWGALCRRLQGRPVESLDEEVKQVRFAAIIARLLGLCDPHRDRLAVLADPDSPPAAMAEAAESLRGDLAGFLSALSEQAGAGRGWAATVDRVVSELEFVGTLPRARDRRKAAREALAFICEALRGEEGRFNRLFLTTYLALHRTGEMAEGGDHAGRSARWLDEFGLAGGLRGAFHTWAEEGSDASPPWGAGTEVLLVKILIAHQSLFPEGEGSGAVVLLERLFADGPAREFLLVHRSGGCEWFNRERFEELVKWLFLAAVAAVGAEGGEKKGAMDAVTGMYGVATGLLARAEKANYRPETLLELVRSSAVSPGPVRRPRT